MKTPSAKMHRSLPIADEAPHDELTAASERGSLRERLEARSAPARLAERLDAATLRCVACAHRCVIAEGRAGACGVRFVRGGELRAPYGYVARRYVRPVETNTIYHVRPGAKALTFGMYGCDLRCPYCHNWRLSQALREEVETEAPTDTSAEALVDEAAAAGCEVLCAAYNEPMIAAEWVRDVFALARARSMLTAVISDGNTTPEALAHLRPVLDVFRVDLKGYSAAQYRGLGGRLEPVLAGVREARRLGLWVEVVTLMVPGFNDRPEGLRALARELASIDPAMPWHLNAFHPRYKLADRPRTDAALLAEAAGTAYARGMQFVYVGNVEGQMRELSHTRCPRCLATLVTREDYQARSVTIGADGRCPACATPIAGLWAATR